MVPCRASSQRAQWGSGGLCAGSGRPGGCWTSGGEPSGRVLVEVEVGRGRRRGVGGRRVVERGRVPCGRLRVSRASGSSRWCCARARRRARRTLFAKPSPLVAWAHVKVALSLSGLAALARASGPLATRSSIAHKLTRPSAGPAAPRPRPPTLPLRPTRSAAAAPPARPARPAVDDALRAGRRCTPCQRGRSSRQESQEDAPHSRRKSAQVDSLRTVPAMSACGGGAAVSVDGRSSQARVTASRAAREGS